VIELTPTASLPLGITTVVGPICEGSDEPLCSGGMPAFLRERRCGGGGVLASVSLGFRERPWSPKTPLVFDVRFSCGFSSASSWPVFRVFALVLRVSSVVAECEACCLFASVISRGRWR